MQRIIGGSIALGIALGSATASAQGKIDNIGNAGGIVVGAEHLAGFYVTKANTQSELSQTVGGTTITSKSDIDIDRTTFAVFGNDPLSPTQMPRLALDYFPIDGLSFGASFIYFTTNGDQKGEASATISGQPPTTTEIDEKLPTESVLIINPRIGYAVAFNETVGLWPRVGFSYTRVSAEQENTETDPQGNEVTYEVTSTASLTHLTLEGLLFVSPFTGFAFVGGPFVDVGLGGSGTIESTEPGTPDRDFDTNLTAYGLTIGIAGYFDTQ